MPNRYELPFQPIYNSTSTSSPSFNSSVLGTTQHSYALECSTAPERTWQGPGSRSVRLMSISGATVDYVVKFGSTIDSVLGSTGGMAIKGSIPEIISVPAGQTHLMVVATTSVAVNVTLGYGG